MLRILALLATANLALAAPNVVVVLTDDQGYGDLSCHGNPDLETPVMDALKGQSTALDRFFVSPTCAPTRAALLTGRHEFECAVSHTIAGRSLLRPGLPTLPELLREAGYTTGIFGKWHLGESFPCRPEDRGFEEVFVHGNGGIGQTGDYWGNGYFDPHVRTKAGWVPTEGYCTEVFFREAGDWMERQTAGDRPFFLWLATNAPHSPYIPPRGAEKPFLEAGVPEPAASFYAMIENIDTELGKLLERIDSLGIAEETVVIFLTDNGTAAGRWNAGMKGRKGTPHEGGVRVPCFIRWPGKIEAGRVVEQPAAHIDLLPTLAAFCGIAAPEGLAGRDLSAALLGEDPFPESATFFTHVGRWPGDESPDRHRSNQFSVRDERWRLVGVELFDMAADPGQERNVFDQHPEVAAQLLMSYGQWWDDVVPVLREPVRYDLSHGKTELTSHDWWPSREDGVAEGLAPWNQDLVRKLVKDRAKSVSGHWKLRASEPGHYQLRLSLLPAGTPELEEIGKLKPGTAHIRTADTEIKLELSGGQTAVGVGLDLNAGPIDLEAWFEGQVEGGGKLGAFFVEIERTGERRTMIPEIRVVPEP